MVSTVPQRTLDFEDYSNGAIMTSLGNNPATRINTIRTENKKFTIYMVVFAMVAFIFVKRK